MRANNNLVVHLLRLVHLVRSAQMKRAITAVDPEPNLNFWRLILGNQLDMAVLEWCKVFGSDGEATHWKKIVPATEHDLFRGNLLSSLGISPEQWGEYWNEMKDYRDNLVAHHFEFNLTTTNYPMLDIAIKSSFFYYKYLIKQLRSHGEHSYRDDLEAYSLEFYKQALEVATQAIIATNTIKERVN